MVLRKYRILTKAEHITKTCDVKYVLRSKQNKKRREFDSHITHFHRFILSEAKRKVETKLRPSRPYKLLLDIFGKKK